LEPGASIRLSPEFVIGQQQAFRVRLKLLEGDRPLHVVSPIFQPCKEGARLRSIAAKAGVAVEALESTADDTYAIRIGGDFLSRIRFIHLIEQDAIVPTISMPKDQLQATMVFRARQKTDIHWSQALDRIWTLLDAEPSVWLELIECASGPAPPPGLRLKVRRYGDDVAFADQLREKLVGDEYLAQWLPWINTGQVPAIKDKDGKKYLEFDVIMLAKPPNE
jgi:hypothetical protein